MRFLLVTLTGLMLASALAAADRSIGMSASGISVPFLDDAGRLSHKLIARSGTKDGPLQNLREIEIRYFSAKDPDIIVQKVQADEATWDEQKETLVGNGRILVATEENRLTGEGFDFALGTSLLHIHHDFRMENREIVLTSDRATIELSIARTGEDLKVRDVKRCEAIGHLVIVVQSTASRTYPFEKAFSELAVYDGAEQTITLPQPTRTQLRKGGTGEAERMTFYLKGPPR